MITEDVKSYYLEKMGITRYVERMALIAESPSVQVMIAGAYAQQDQERVLLDKILQAVRLPVSGCEIMDVDAMGATPLTDAIQSKQPRVIVALGPVVAGQLFGPGSSWETLREGVQIHPPTGVPVVITDDLITLREHPVRKARAYLDWCTVASLV